MGHCGSQHAYCKQARYDSDLLARAAERQSEEVLGKAVADVQTSEPLSTAVGSTNFDIFNFLMPKQKKDCLTKVERFRDALTAAAPSLI